MFLTIDGVGSLATENGLQIARFYPYLVELKLRDIDAIFLPRRPFYPHLVELKRKRVFNFRKIVAYSFILT